MSLKPGEIIRFEAAHTASEFHRTCQAILHCRFEIVVRRCMFDGLVSGVQTGQGFAVVDLVDNHATGLCTIDPCVHAVVMVDQAGRHMLSKLRMNCVADDIRRRRPAAVAATSDEHGNAATNPP